MSKPKMNCIDCGTEMNHHALKINYGADQSARFDADFDGIVEEIHACPECGQTAMRAT